MKRQLAGRALTEFQKRLLTWFRTHQRDLPWRTSREPYRIWVAEIMLQQTRIAAVMPYYERFLEHFPTVESLAAAPQQEVLKLWSGLGYYSRARNLHLAAKQIVAEHNGKFPRTLEAALELPGIGVYTAAAVLSIAYDVPLAVLDGNVARVLARIHAVRGDLRVPRTWRALTEKARPAAGAQNGERLEPGADGTGRSDLHAEIAALPGVSGGEIVPGVCGRNYQRDPRAAKETCAGSDDDRCGDSARPARAARCWCAIPARTTKFCFPGCGNSPPFTFRARRNRNWRNISRETFGLKKLTLEELPSARHGVTFRNITLLPFLARVPELPKLPRSRFLALKNLTKVPVSSATKKLAAAVTEATRRGSAQAARRQVLAEHDSLNIRLGPCPMGRAHRCYH